MSIMLLLGFLLTGIIFFSAIFPLKNRWKYLWLIPVVFFSFKYHTTRFFGGNYFTPELPGWVILWWAVALEIMIFYALFLLLGDIIWLFVPKKHRFRYHRIMIITALAAAVIPAFIGTYNAIKPPRINRKTITISKLQNTGKPLKISVISDLHVDKINNSSRLKKIVQLSNAERPDIVVLTGDLVDGPPEALAQEMSPLKELYAPYGVYMVPGNHEYYSNWDIWRPEMLKLGFKVLENQHLTTDTPAGPVVIAGTTDFSAHHFGHPYPNVEQALSGKPDDLPVILLFHQPVEARSSAELGVDLQISGHTHGGMMPILAQMVAAKNNGFISGFYQVDKMTLALSNGTGIWNGFPFRFGAPSEIMLLTLVPEDNPQ